MADKPKRPLSAYMLWLNDNREAIKKENPGIKVTEVAKRGGELWRGLKDKSKWDQKAVEAKEAYNRALKTYEANGGGRDSGAGKKRSKGGRSKPAKKGKKKNDSEEDDDEDESE